jgi:hypothetical protein
MADDAVAGARGAARSWLALVDSGRYGESWTAAASFFRSSIPQQSWEAAVSSVRGPIGPLQSRHFRSATYTRSLPGVPDGEYVVIQYDAQFQNKAAAVETVTPMRESDGSWKVSGYYIR